MHAYVINLRRSQDRRAYMVKQLAQTTLDYEFVDAVDSRGLSETDQTLIAPQLRDAGRDWRSVAACMLSHRKAYLSFLQSADTVALILEDDMELPPTIGTLCDDIAPHMTGAEVVMLYLESFRAAGRQEACHFLADTQLRITPDHSLFSPVDLADLGSACAYLITREAGLRLAAGVIPVAAPIDHWHLYCMAGFIDRIRCVLPLPVSTNPRFRTTIGDHAADSLQARVRRILNAMPIAHTILAARRRRRSRLATRTSLVNIHRGTRE